MVAVKGNIKEMIVDLSEEAWKAFADDISTMFEVDIDCSQTEIGVKTIADIQKRYKKVSTFHTVQAQGVLEGNFLVGFDMGGLFTLSGVIVMLPPKRIKETAKRGTIEDAESINDAVGEVGNLLVGAWDRVFREEMDGHKHFRKGDTYIGIPWDDPEKAIGIKPTDEFQYIEYDMKLDEYPGFKCAVLFPMHFLDTRDSAVESEPESEKTEAVVVSPEENVKDAVVEPEVQEDKADDIKEESEDAQENPSEPESQSEPEPEIEAETENEGLQGEPSSLDSVPVETEDISESQPQENIQPEEVDDQSAAQQDVSQPVSRPMPVSVNDNGLSDILSLPVKDIMDTRIVWASPNDSVQDLLGKMQQHDVGYTVIGDNGVLEGIVSKSNILGAISPYLRPVFAKWHTPADDATLNIKIQWIMSRPVKSVRPDAPMSVAMHTMQQFGGRCLPVVDDTGAVVGMVTVFDIFRVLTQNDQFAMTGRTPQAPCLMI